jgi:plasmid maintenance system antidote protein VapI
MAGETKRLLLRLIAERQLHTNREIGELLGVTGQAISLLMSGQRTMGAATAMRLCDLLGLDVGDTLRKLEAERTQRGKRGARSRPRATVTPLHFGKRRPQQRTML